MRIELFRNCEKRPGINIVATTTADGYALGKLAGDLLAARVPFRLRPDDSREMVCAIMLPEKDVVAPAPETPLGEAVGNTMPTWKCLNCLTVNDGCRITCEHCSQVRLRCRTDEVQAGR